MNYRSNDSLEELSILGFGCMRFPKKGNSIDMEETEREIMHAIDCGINYFDTAYIYRGSESTLGTILAKNHCREKIKIATKLPHYLIKKSDDIDRYFEEQCKRLQTNYIDYYLMHMLPDVNVWKRLIDLGILTWLERMKSEGRIKKVGFSYHGNTASFLELLEAYDWEFCQIQYNYLDEHSQAGRKGLEQAAAKNIPVIIMEPLRGGRLANQLPKKAVKIFHDADSTKSPAEWALRWLWNQKGVSVVLSGMNSMEMLDENIRIASEVKVNEMSETTLKIFDKVVKAINEKVKVPCTACSYCMPCPKGVDIPGAFRCYNASYIDGFSKGFQEYLLCTTLRKNRSNASLCVECGLCEQHCPQEIKIRKELKLVKKRLENPLYKITKLIIRKRY